VFGGGAGPPRRGMRMGRGNGRGREEGKGKGGGERNGKEGERRIGEGRGGKGVCPSNFYWCPPLSNSWHRPCS